MAKNDTTAGADGYEDVEVLLTESLKEDGQIREGIYIGFAWIKLPGRRAGEPSRLERSHIFLDAKGEKFALWNAGRLGMALDNADLGRMTRITRIGKVEPGKRDSAIDYRVQQKGAIDKSAILPEPRPAEPQIAGPRY